MHVAKRIDALQARRLMARGAQVVDVLPQSIYEQEHLPGAISLALETMDARAAQAALERDETVVVYCFDQH